MPFGKKTFLERLRTRMRSAIICASNIIGRNGYETTKDTCFIDNYIGGSADRIRRRVHRYPRYFHHNLHGGRKEYAAVTLSGDETPSAPADPEKTGYNFVGWFMDETFATPFNFAEYAANPDRTNIIVYAKFEIISTSVTYMVDDAEYKVLTVEGVNAEAPNYVPEKAGYKFVGWFTDDTLETPFDFEEYAADEGRTNITVYAKFEIISTTVTYMTDDIKYQSFTVE